LRALTNPQSYLPWCYSLLELSDSSDDPGAAGTDDVEAAGRCRPGAGSPLIYNTVPEGGGWPASHPWEPAHGQAGGASEDPGSTAARGPAVLVVDYSPELFKLA
jgi:hypothetical protein